MKEDLKVDPSAVDGHTTHASFMLDWPPSLPIVCSLCDQPGPDERALPAYVLTVSILLEALGRGTPFWCHW